jgi:hypothetical protein
MTTVGSGGACNAFASTLTEATTSRQQSTSLQVALSDDVRADAELRVRGHPRRSVAGCH